MNCQRHNIFYFQDDTLCPACVKEARGFATARLIVNHLEEYKLIEAKEIGRLMEAPTDE